MGDNNMQSRHFEKLESLLGVSGRKFKFRGELLLKASMEDILMIVGSLASTLLQRTLKKDIILAA
jgi:hypothetical protein